MPLMFKFLFRPKIEISRELKTKDVVERIGVITARKVKLIRYPIDRPVTIFNPSISIEDSEVIIYGRIILGYFTYASAVAEFTFPLECLYSKDITALEHNAEITVLPDNKYDLWGVEDPRVYTIKGKKLMTYCGRTVNYFNPSIRMERTLPVTAVRENKKWRKICVFKFPEELKEYIISDKDAFLADTKEGLRLFHRPHLTDEKFYLVISELSKNPLELRKFEEVYVKKTRLVIDNANFEEKVGWGTPPVKVGKEYVLLLHGVERETKCYRVFAMLMDENARVTAVTPCYIMEPRENYEVYGDRPFTVFPCGAEIIDDDLIVTYGAADSAIGIGKIDISELMSILESGRI